MNPSLARATKPESHFGVYVHIPYCRRVCPYCDFNVHIAKRAEWRAYGEAVCTEIAARAESFAGISQVDSLYFGGGTPSLCPPGVLRDIMSAITARWPVAAGAEITLEVDPKTLDAEGYIALRGLGVTRVSLGWQSTHDRLLHRLGRGHSAADSEQAFSWARAAGFDDVSVDLIFAVPDETMTDLEGDLERVLALRPEHVSLYALTFHEGTTFHRWRAAGRLAPVDDELEAAMMTRIEERLVGAGYEHYEVSNYARPGFRSTHNSLYWSGEPYLGVGAGAHSFLREALVRGWRWESVRAPGAYVAAMRGATDEALPRTDAGRDAPTRAGAAVGEPTTTRGTALQPPIATDPGIAWLEELAAGQLARERFMLALRLGDGLSARERERLCASGAVERTVVEEALREGAARGWLHERAGAVVPTSTGLMNADALAALFF